MLCFLSLLSGERKFAWFVSWLGAVIRFAGGKQMSVKQLIYSKILWDLTLSCIGDMATLCFSHTVPLGQVPPPLPIPCMSDSWNMCHVLHRPLGQVPPPLPTRCMSGACFMHVLPLSFLKQVGQSLQLQ